MSATHGPPAVQFRHHAGQAVAGLIVAISTASLAGVRPYLGLLVLLPLAWTIWVWRAGTDADHDGLRVRALLGQRRIPWSAVAALGPDRRGHVVATLTSGRAVRLTAVPPTGLTRLVAASGQQPAAPPGDDPSTGPDGRPPAAPAR